MDYLTQKILDNLYNFLPEKLYSEWTSGVFSLFTDKEKKQLWVNINQFFDNDYSYSYNSDDGIKIGVILDFGCDCIRFFNEHKDLCTEEMETYLNKFPSDLKSDWLYSNHYELTTANSKHYFWIILPELIYYFNINKNNITFTEEGIDFGNFIDFIIICLVFFRENKSCLS